MVDLLPSPARLLIVDDEDPARRLMARILESHGFSCELAPDAAAARSLLTDHHFDVVITDMAMPGPSGLELILELKDRRPDTVTLMMTGTGTNELAQTVIASGAYGYVTKPIHADEAFIAVLSALERRALELDNRHYRERLEVLVTDRTSKLWETNLTLTQREEDLRLSREETVTRLALAAEAHDDETARHVERMSRITGRLYGKVTGDQEGADLVRVATVLHDVGKLGIPDSILRKPGRLTEEERHVIRGHAEIGNRILAGSESKLLQLAAVIALTHHERNDGTGYPEGLKGDEIPIEAKLAAIADTFDALTSNRVYRKAFELRDALSMMRGRRASHFDADLLDLFFESIDEIIGPLGPEALASHRLASTSADPRGSRSGTDGGWGSRVLPRE